MTNITYPVFNNIPFELAKEYVLKQDCINYTNTVCREPTTYIILCVIALLVMFWFVYMNHRLKKELKKSKQNRKRKETMLCKCGG